MTGEEWKKKRAEIDILIAEYEKEAFAAAAWYVAWKEKYSGFRCVRRNGENNK